MRSYGLAPNGFEPPLLSEHTPIAVALHAEQGISKRPAPPTAASVAADAGAADDRSSRNPDGAIQYRCCRFDCRTCAREYLGVKKFAKIEAKHQKCHAERRKKRTEFDIHEIYNGKVDSATHTARGNDTAYVSFAPLSTDRTGVWYEPLVTENVGAGTAYEVTSDAYRHITLAAQRRTANEYAVEKDGLFLTTFSQGAFGRSAKEGTAVRTTKMMHGHLPTAARMAM